MNKLVFAWAILAMALGIGCSRTATEKEVEKTFDGCEKVKTYEVKGSSKKLVKEEEFYPGGELKMTGAYVDEKRQGEWVAYFKNGKLWSRGSFEKGERHDSAWVYHTTGVLYYTGLYQFGKREGKWTFYDDYGNFIKHVWFSNDSVVKEDTLINNPTNATIQ